MRYMAFVKMSEDGGSSLRRWSRRWARRWGRRSRPDGRCRWSVPAGAEHRDPGHRRNITVTDGPYAEVKEVIGGYSILELQSQHEAIAAARRVAELHREHWPEWEGSVEVRQIAGPDEGPACKC